jgi:hypothetical protein
MFLADGNDIVWIKMVYLDKVAPECFPPSIFSLVPFYCISQPASDGIQRDATSREHGRESTLGTDFDEGKPS